MKKKATFRSGINAAVAGSFIVVLVALYILIVTTPAVPSRGITSFGGLLFTGFIVATIWLLARIATARIEATENGVKIINIFHTKSVAWDEINEFTYGPKYSWSLVPTGVTVQLIDKTEIVSSGVQGGKPAPRLSKQTYETKAVAELNAMLERIQLGQQPFS